MKIATIILEGVRAFDEPFELDLENGKNLLLHGENGSGKSSLYLALRHFFDPRGETISKHRNCFSSDTRDSVVRVHFVKTGAAPFEIAWTASAHPGPVPADPATATVTPEQRAVIVDGARRGGFVDYRMLLRTHLFSSPLSRFGTGARTSAAVASAESRGMAEQFFDLAAGVILAGVRTTVAGGTETTIGDLIQRVWSTPPRSRRAAHLDAANAVCRRFNDAFNGVLPDLEARLATFLGHFDNHQLGVTFRPVSVSWEKSSLSLKGAQLVPEVTFRGRAVAGYQQFLNEARLSALAVCMFLSGVSIANTDPGNPDHPRFLLLDDALIGLELQNRLPILDILKSHFDTYQICLLTHDRVWFDLARGNLPTSSGWLHKELLAEEGAGRLVPVVRPHADELDRAKAHLANGDLVAASVYARVAFEGRLRNVCEKRGIRVSYKKEQRHFSVDTLWQGIVERQKDRVELRKQNAAVQDFVPTLLQQDVETVRSTVLNQLSHAGAPGLVQAEVAKAISVIERVCGHDFPDA